MTEAVALTASAETLTTKLGRGLHTGAVRGKELAESAGERGRELAEAAGDRSAPLIKSARNLARALWKRPAIGWAQWLRMQKLRPDDSPGTETGPDSPPAGRLGRTDVPLRRSP